MKTIILKKDAPTTYYITSLTSQQYNMIHEYNKLGKIAELSNILPINSKGILLLGNIENKDKLSVSTSVRDYLETFTRNTGGEKQVHYRDYTKPLEKQKEMAWLINIAPDFKVCWNTILITLNQPKYCVIWRDDTDKKFEYVREF